MNPICRKVEWTQGLNKQEIWLHRIQVNIYLLLDEIPNVYYIEQKLIP